MCPLPAVTFDPDGRARSAVIWLHGLGADGHDFAPIVPELGLPPELAVRFIFPHAPTRPITINAGMRMRAWYDIRDFHRADREDAEGIEESRGLVEELIAAERSRGIPSRRIVIGGFSQGGALALHASLRHGERLAGALIFSGYLPLAGSLAAERSDENRDLPIFIAHGTGDPILPFEYARSTKRALEALGYPVSFHSYPIPHSVSEDEIRTAGDWLRRVLDSA